MRRYEDREKRKAIGTSAALLLGGTAVMHGGHLLHTLRDNYGTPEERKALRSLKLELLKHGVTRNHLLSSAIGDNGMYIPDIRQVAYPFGGTRTGLHEYGHATMERKSLLGAARRLNLQMGYGLGHLKKRYVALGAALAPSYKEGKGSVQGAAIGGALAVPMLAEEALANLQAARKIVSTSGVRGVTPALRYLASSLPAYSTYLGHAMRLVGAGFAGGALRDYIIRRNKRNKQRK